MQAIEQQHAHAVLEAHILALKTLTDLLLRETDPTEQRRIAAIILRTKPTRPKPVDQPPAPPKPRNAKPTQQPPDGLDLDEDDDLDADDRPFTHRDLDTLRQIMNTAASQVLADAPPSQHTGTAAPSS